MKKLIGIIQKDGSVKTGRASFWLPLRGTDEEGFPEVLIDTKNVGGEGNFHRQSIKSYVGMKVEFIVNEGTEGPYSGFNYTIIK